MKSLPRWVGISVSLHVALGVGVWAAGSWTGEPLQATSTMSAMAVELIRSSDVPPPSDPVAAGAAAMTLARPPARIAPPTEASVSRPDETPSAITDIKPTAFDSALSIAGSSIDSVDVSDSPRHDHEVTEPSNASSVSPLRSASEESAAMSLDDYRPLVLTILDRAKHYPLLLQRRGLEGVVDLTFLISSEGKIIGSRIVVPSAHRWLNEESLAMLGRVASLPPPPDGVPVQFPVRIEYRLESIASPISAEGAYP